MRTIWMAAAVMMLVSASAFAGKANLEKDGTQWVWQVPSEDSGIVILLEDDSKVLSEDEKIVKVQEGVNDALFNALIAQGWVASSSSANVPQGISGTAYADVYGYAVAEDDSFLVDESNNNLRSEN